MTRRNLHDDVHLAAHAGVVDWNDGSRPLGDRRFDQALVHVERVRPDIDEDRGRAPQDEGVCGRYERERRHDHFVARLHQQHGSHFERGRARVGQQAGGAKVILEPSLALGRKVPSPARSEPAKHSFTYSIS